MLFLKTVFYERSKERDAPTALDFFGDDQGASALLDQSPAVVAEAAKFVGGPANAFKFFILNYF